jgi:hypothetical protein
LNLSRVVNNLTMAEENPGPLIAAKVRAALAEDARCRHKGVTDGLYRFPDDVAEFQRLGPGVDIPCVMPTAREFKRVGSAREFRKRLSRECGTLFADFDFAAHGLCMAGGAVSALANVGTTHYPFDTASRFDDYDFFLVGHASDEAAIRAINEFAEHLAACWKEMYVYRTKQCVTFVCDENEKPVQVILRRYSTVAEVIHGFDLGSSAFLWDGKALWTTALGKLAAEHAVNVLNLPARRGSYERRLARYFERGFGLVLPDLDVEAFRVSGMDAMPHLHLGTRLTLGVGSLYIGASSLKHPGREDDAPSDYMSQVITYGNPESALPLNLRALAAEGAPLCAAAEWTFGMDVTQIQPTYSAETLARYVRDCFTPATVHTKKLYAVLGAATAGELMRDHLVRVGLPDAPLYDKSLIAALSDATVRRAAEHGSVLPFAFMTVEENTALTGPFPRAVIPPSQWYGPVFRQEA